MHFAQNIESAIFCPTFSDGKKLRASDQTSLWVALNEDRTRSSRQMLQCLEERGTPLDVSVRHINRLRHEWGLSRGKGRPPGKSSVGKKELYSPIVKVSPHVSFAGVFLFAAWMESHGDFEKVVELLQQGIESYVQSHPEADFPMLYHKPETLKRRFEALFYAPLFGIKKLTEFDLTRNPLKSLVGVGYHSSTLNQFLGQLARIDAGDALREALLPDESGIVGYVDGHMIAYWSRKSMHKGKITMLGRIMAGSQAIVTHNQNGHALAIEYYPPDMRMPNFIVAYCEKIAQSTSIEVFV
ncbi:MAG: hypothetical protein HQK67_10035, partial [Desulfamplus sp.]|nr:hypothetical protein [Desulfamplus sp.]